MTSPRDQSPEIDGKEYERRITLRPLRIEDFDALIAMQRASFPGMATWGRDQIESQVKHFPDGQLVIEIDGEIVASASCLIVEFDEYSDWHNWKEIADNGYIKNHDPEGDTLYGIEIMVHPKHRGLKLARRLYEARKELCRRLNLMRIIIGGRIPGYHRFAEEMSAREYAEEVVSRGLYDPVLTTQVANGFVLKRLIPDYFPSDEASRGYATFLEWTNLEHVPERHRQLRRVQTVRVCAIQYQMREISDFDDFRKQVEFFVDAASEDKSDFVLFPELLTTQLLSYIGERRPADAARALAQITPDYLELFNDLAIKYNVNIVGGSQFALEEGSLVNNAYLFRRDGTIEEQSKLHVTPAERRWWGVEPGEGVKVFETDRGRVAILVCYDIEFPELTRIAVAKGAQILFVPFNTNNRDGYLRIRHCAQARCIENHVYAVLSGCVGNLPFVANADVHYAQSGIYTPCDFEFPPDGIAAECTANLETLVIRDLDLAHLRRHRATGTVQNWNDRRGDLSEVSWREPGDEGSRRV